MSRKEMSESTSFCLVDCEEGGSTESLSSNFSEGPEIIPKNNMGTYFVAKSVTVVKSKGGDPVNFIEGKDPSEKVAVNLHALIYSNGHGVLGCDGPRLKCTRVTDTTGNLIPVVKAEGELKVTFTVDIGVTFMPSFENNELQIVTDKNKICIKFQVETDILYIMENMEAFRDRVSAVVEFIGRTNP